MQAVLNFLGAIFTAASAYLIYSGCRMSIAVPAKDLGGFLPQGMDGVANLGLIHANAITFQLGVGAGIVAAIFIVGAAIVGALDRPAADATFDD